MGKRQLSPGRTCAIKSVASFPEKTDDPFMMKNTPMTPAENEAEASAWIRWAAEQSQRADDRTMRQHINDLELAQAAAAVAK